MEQAAVDFLTKVFGVETIALLIILGAGVYIVWKLSARYTKRTTEIDNLPCKKHEEDIDKLTTSINNVNVTLGKLETGQEDIHKIISMMASSPSQSVFTQSHSPISLTEKGKKIAETLKLDNVLENNWGKIENIIDDEKNPYDIQMEFISKFIVDSDKYIDSGSLDMIKNDAYLSGIPLIDYMRMLGVMARDKYFMEHQIDIAEVDRNDPHLG